MTDAIRRHESTALRQSFERVRSYSLEKQMRECIDSLQHPEVVVDEVLGAYRTMLDRFEYGPFNAKAAAANVDAVPPATLVEDYFWETRELIVHGDAYSFTCLATNVDPLAPFRDARTAPARAGLSTGLDYVGLTCNRHAVVVLGAVQSPGDASAYPLLLRLLACLTEIAPRAQLERMNREHFRGIADPARPFDLHLVLWDRGEEPEATPVCELTRDLAERVKYGLRDATNFPTRLGHIVCLRMNPERFDGRMRFYWKV